MIVYLLRTWFIFAALSMSYAAFQTAILEGWDVALQLTGYWWFNATLLDVYLGLSMFSFWVFYKTSAVRFGWVKGIFWLIFFFSTGNIGTAIYALVVLFSIAPGASAREIATQFLLRRDHV